jgi:hypothetical protein
MTSTDVTDAAFINVSNEDLENKNTLEGQLFFSSILEFKSAFTRNLPKHVGNRVVSINVKTDFNRIDAPETMIESHICIPSFQWLGLK